MADYHSERDLVYGKIAGKERLLDVYLPARPAAPMPLVMWIHGGAFRHGDKSNCEAALSLLGRGYALASIAYRLSGEAVFPAQIVDCKAALRWLKAQSGRFGWDAARVGVWGPSAGGHLAAMVGLSAHVEAWEQGDCLDWDSGVQAVCDWFGPSDFLRMNDTPGAIDHEAADSPESHLVGAPIRSRPDLVAKANPITYVTPQAPPFLIVHGKEDRIVPPNQSELLHAALERTGVPSRLVLVEGAGHGFKGAEGERPRLVGMVGEFFERCLVGAG